MSYRMSPDLNPVVSVAKERGCTVQIAVRGARPYNHRRWWICFDFKDKNGDSLHLSKQIRESHDATHHSFSFIQGRLSVIIEILEANGIPYTGFYLSGVSDRQEEWIDPAYPWKLCDKPHCMDIFESNSPDPICPRCKSLERHDKAARLAIKWMEEATRRELKIRKQARSRQLVYLIQNGDSDQYKIGITVNLKGRIGSIQTSNPSKVGLVYAITPKNGLRGDEIESNLHEYFSDCNTHNEWFQFTEDRVAECISLMNKVGEKIETNLSSQG